MERASSRFTDYGDPNAECQALRENVALLDLSARGRLCLLGQDRQRFLNGQVTNDVGRLKPGSGCYALLVNAKGRIESDLNIHLFDDEILLDLEAGFQSATAARLEKFIIGEDVQIVDLAGSHGLLSLVGPRAEAVLGRIRSLSFPAAPTLHLGSAHGEVPGLGDIYCINLRRAGLPGFDLLVPLESIVRVADLLLAAVHAEGGCLAGSQALETARIEAAVPRFGVDMDATNLAPEPGLGERAISYSKGCYIGQEVIARIRTYGQVTKNLKPMQFGGELAELPQRGAKLCHDGREVGYVTSVIHSERLNGVIGIGYVRREIDFENQQLRLAPGPWGDSVPVRARPSP